MRKLGINLNATVGLSILETAKEVAALGFDSALCGTSTPKDMIEIEKAVHGAGLTFDQLHAPFVGINSIWRPGEAGDTMYKKLTDAVDCCVALDAPIATVHVAGDLDPEMITDIGRGRFTNLVEYAAKKGVKLAFENQSVVFTLAWIFEEFKDADNVGFCWDIGHQECATPEIEMMALFGDRLICTHMQDNYSIYIEDPHMVPFDGKVDFERAAMWMNKHNYKGGLTLEVFQAPSSIYKDMTAQEFLAHAYKAACRIRTLVDGE